MDENFATGTPPRPVIAIRIQRIDRESRRDEADLLTVEEPLEIQVSAVRNGRRKRIPVSVTMRTPGHDRELAAGFLLTEGLVHDRRDILAIQPCRQGNRVRVILRDEVDLDFKRLRRHFYTTSSCGVCGKTSIDAIRACRLPAIELDQFVIPSPVIHQLPVKLRAAQAVFDRTGGIHASALFDNTGHMLALREDVGRHNALDKLIGGQFLSGQTPLTGRILLLSGRISFELVQKAAMAGIAMVAAVGAPSSLAVSLAQELKMTLVGFVREDRFNVYCGMERVRMDLPQSVSV